MSSLGIYIIGLICASIALGQIITDSWGGLLFGVGLMALSLILKDSDD